MDDRSNTIAGWVLFAGIVALGSSIVADEVFHSERPEELGYPIPGVVAEGDGADAEKPFAFYLASADPAEGEQVFKKCVTCHTIEKGGPAMLGPNLWGVMGDDIASAPGFAFSPALTEHPGNWTWESMSEWLKSPKGFAPGTKMTFAGLGNPEERAAIILFLNQKDDSPLPVPAAPDQGVASGGEATDATATGETPATAEKEPVVGSTAADVKGGGPAARQ